MALAPGEIEQLLSYVDIVSLVEELGAARVERSGGRTFACCCLYHDERTESMKLYPDQAKFHCYGCGENGDAVDLVRAKLGLDFLDAVRWLAKRSGYWPEGLTNKDGDIVPKAVPATKPKPRVKDDKRLKWRVITPVPAKVGEPRLGTFETWLPSAKRRVMPSAMWCYRDARGQLLGVDVRYDYLAAPHLVTKPGERVLMGKRLTITEIDGDYLITKAGNRIRNNLAQYFKVGDKVTADDQVALVSGIAGDNLELDDGRYVPAAAAQRCKKDAVTWTWCENIDTGEQCWRMRAWPDPSPLYGLDQLAARPDDEVLICEGCKAAAAGGQKFDKPAMSWRGGCKTVLKFEKNDWAPLAGRRVLIWPDADPQGIEAAWYVAKHLRQVGAASVRVADVSGLPDGWDLADELPEVSA